MRIAILLFDGFTALDVIGGYEVLSRVPDWQVEFVAKKRGIVATDSRLLGFTATAALSEQQHYDALYLPGGPGVANALQDLEINEFLKDKLVRCKLIFTVCNGALLAASNCDLSARTMATNYFCRPALAALGVKVCKSRYTRDHNVFSAAGVSASTDLAFFIVKELVSDHVARLIQLGIEYFPQAPFPDTPHVDDCDAQLKAYVAAHESPQNIAKQMVKQPTFTHIGSN